jgi:hypothetical protein
LAAVGRHRRPFHQVTREFRPDLEGTGPGGRGTTLAPCLIAVAPRELLLAMPMTPSSADRRPTVDEWGVYDPQQAGLAALYTKLATKASTPPDTAEASPAEGEGQPAAKPSSR